MSIVVICIILSIISMFIRALKHLLFPILGFAVVAFLAVNYFHLPNINIGGIPLSPTGIDIQNMFHHATKQVAHSVSPKPVTHPLTAPTLPKEPTQSMSFQQYFRGILHWFATFKL